MTADYKNRLTDPLPDQPCTIRIIKTDVDGDQTYICDWLPFNKSQHNENSMPAHGYLGTARVAIGPHRGIRFNVWQQNDQEFVYYQIL